MRTRLAPAADYSVVAGIKWCRPQHIFIITKNDYHFKNDINLDFLSNLRANLKRNIKKYMGLTRTEYHPIEYFQQAEHEWK